MFKMKRLRESMIAKLAAWVFCIASAMGSIVLGVFMLIGVSEDLFHKSRVDSMPLLLLPQFGEFVEL